MKGWRFFWGLVLFLFSKEIYSQVSSVPIGSSGNVFTILDGSVNRLAANNNLNTVVFIHNSNNSLFNPVHFRYDISTDGGNTWASNLGDLNPSANAIDYAGRFPNVVIHNPLGNTNPNNAYLG